MTTIIYAKEDGVTNKSTQSLQIQIYYSSSNGFNIIGILLFNLVHFFNIMGLCWCFAHMLITRELVDMAWEELDIAPTSVQVQMENYYCFLHSKE